MCTRKELMSMDNCKVDQQVVSSWIVLMNKQEELRSSTSPNRFYIPVVKMVCFIMFSQCNMCFAYLFTYHVIIIKVNMLILQSEEKENYDEFILRMSAILKKFHISKVEEFDMVSMMYFFLHVIISIRRYYFRFILIDFTHLNFYSRFSLPCWMLKPIILSSATI